MMSKAIRNFLRKDPRCLMYKTTVVCGRNELPLQIPLARPCLYMVNSLETSESGIGHWTCFVFPDPEEGNKCIFFDPLGKAPIEYGTEFYEFHRIGGCLSVRANAGVRLQERFSIKCGEYCIYFASRYIEFRDCNTVLLDMIQTNESQLLAKLEQLQVL